MVFNKKTIKDDMMGGLLAAIIGLPMGLAFGMQSGLGPQAGIYTAVVLAIFGSFFGGTRTIISDPTGPMTVVAATVVTLGLTQAGSIENAWPFIVATFALAGIFQVIFGILDLGKYVKYMPYPVLSGFMAGIGIIIISVQLFPMLGHTSPKGFSNILLRIGEPISNINWAALGLCTLTIATIYLLPKITKTIPSILVALISGTLISIVFKLDIPIIGEIPTELPTLHLNEIFNLKMADLNLIFIPAIMLAGLGVIDTLLTSVVADNLTKTKHNSKKTVIGQGVGNFLVALIGGIPGAGATMGTVTNIKAGAQSKISGVMKGVFLLLIVAGIAQYVQYIPMAVLAGILITIGIGIIDYKGLNMLFKIPRSDAAIFFIVLLVTLFDNLLDAVAVGFILSAILFIGKMSKAMGYTQASVNLEDYINKTFLPEDVSKNICIKSLDGPLFFGFADQFRDQCRKTTNFNTIILRMNNVPFLDQSGIVTLEYVIEEWQKRGIKVFIVGANLHLTNSLEKVGLIPNIVHNDQSFKNMRDCLTNIVKVSSNKERKIKEIAPVEFG